MIKNLDKLANDLIKRSEPADTQSYKLLAINRRKLIQNLNLYSQSIDIEQTSLDLKSIARSNIKLDIEKKNDLLTSLLISKNNESQKNKYAKKCTNKSDT